MPCTPIPVVPVPSLPPGLTLGAALPTPEFAPELCCKLLPFELSVPPAALGIPLNAGIAATLTVTLKTLTDYLLSLPVKCPRE
jgi:hypothetical protein